ncbi:hypothetical protein HYPSUDRAFT_934114 [Hypholoma sublateritium FD-334 SS-4]|uniref:Uncharacterized protein n=1 Tax=Hypholoma sublateritium (strain FD-334 SS-4) TaxID=945553 RepID=A0A0D2MTS6_HYPSF|nr:hypothetical protein HYPSUDRAFT_934114 [Hypholoma sublateritium FD-334 SS-4]
MQRSRGGLYAICFDCNSAPSNTSFIIDAFNATDDGENPPVLLYRQSFSTPALHHITIKNMPDPRGTPAGNSQLTVQRIELEVQSSSTSFNASSPVTVTSSISLSSEFTAIASASPSLVSSINPLSTTNSFTSRTSGPAPTVSSDTKVQSKPSIGILLGALAALAFVLSIIVLIYWLRLQRKYARDPFPLDENASALRHSRHLGAGLGPIAGAPPDEPSDSPSQAAPGSASYLSAHQRRGHPRRERDLGPLPRVAEEGTIVCTEKGNTLPPAYGKVFAPRRQPRQTRRNAARRDEYAEIR